MSLHVQLYRARRDHARYGLLARMEQAGSRPDAVKLAQLKKRRLEAKDRIVRFEEMIGRASRPAFA